MIDNRRPDRGAEPHDQQKIACPQQGQAERGEVVQQVLEREDAELGIGVIGVVLGVLGEPREDLAAQSARMVDDKRRDRQTFEQ